MKPLTISTALLAAALFAGPSAAQNQQQVTGTGQFCLKGQSGPVKCEYQTLAQCHQALPLWFDRSMRESARAFRALRTPRASFRAGRTEGLIRSPVIVSDQT